MIVPPAGVRVLVATRPVDFRCGADRLASIVQTVLGHDPFSGTVYVFRCKRSDRAKLLVCDDRPWGGHRSAGGGLYLRARPRQRARGEIAEGLPRHPADRRLRRLQGGATASGDTGAAMDDGVVLAHCWAHCRRRFYEIAQKRPAPIAREALQRIAALYQIEAEIRGLSADERRAVRQLRTKPLLDAMRFWLEQRRAELPRKSPLAEAVGYPLNQWEGLTRFVDDGRIEIDSNTVERSMRPIALNRKNALFAGHDLGAENWAVLASLIETCKWHGVNPEA
jgi:transposase